MNDTALSAISKYSLSSKKAETLANELIIKPFHETIILSSVPGAILDFLCFLMANLDFSKDDEISLSGIFNNVDREDFFIITLGIEFPSQFPDLLIS